MALPRSRRWASTRSASPSPGAAPCPAEVIEFWHGLGLPLCEVYGMSETTGVATVNAPGAVRIGTGGRPLPGVEVALSDAGEVLMRGPVVMRGYRNRPEATAEALDADGWMHSGDIGVFDEDGYLRIVDRIKELIISAAGKNMSPANIEATVKSAGAVIGCVCAIGDGRPYNVALVTLDPEAAARVDDPEAEVAAQIARANEKLARVERIRRFAVLADDWLPGGDELTPTMKLKRKPIAAKYAAEIEALYDRSRARRRRLRSARTAGPRTAARVSAQLSSVGRSLTLRPRISSARLIR